MTSNNKLISFESTSWTETGDETLKMAVGPTSIWRVKLEFTVTTSLIETKAWTTLASVSATDIGVGTEGSVYNIDNTDRANDKGKSFF